MDAFNDSIFEEKYKDFLTVRREWLKLVFKHAVYTDINTQGAACRPVALLTDSTELAQADALLLAWHQFAELAEHKRAAGLSPASSQLYLPMPAILSQMNSFTIGAFESTTTLNFVREEILRKIDKKLNQLYKSKHTDLFAITNLEQDKILIGHYPAGTRFRRRTTGYKDVIVDTCEHDTNETRYRVGTHGVIIDGRRLSQPDAYDINTGDKYTDYNSCYDLISPVRCSLFAGSSLYLIDDIERAKAARTVVSQKRASESRKQEATRRKDQNWLAQQHTQREEKRRHKIAAEKQKAQSYAQQQQFY
ncbi:hypothetical protein [Xenorhabdus szentirmaii]|uniref:Uncharacterized protein n=1 Tax=Xenorhabdus szentirmaii DSM 16338 TaxID=1427518 RepID=W1J0P0_9GAMM|nr:hypothetical protein [Xenorhabdus szentirmaii]PHM30473.1 hypothetical protein Xsze_04316 [Xenorhabdus szentirmaii DSM 16338]CDL83648.1 hypothetical protein XSR1_340048 [Xenorhabdus szentirmaii DSM 16338]